MNMTDVTTLPHDASIDNRLTAIDSKLEELSALMDVLSVTLWNSQRPRLLLVGWNEIATAVRKRPSTLRRYVRREGLPVARWGRHAVTTPALIEDWLLTREEARQARPWKPHPDSYRGPRSQRPRAKQAQREAEALSQHFLSRMNQPMEDRDTQ